MGQQPYILQNFNRMLFKDIMSNFRGKPKKEKTAYDPDPGQFDRKLQRLKEESRKMMPPIDDQYQAPGGPNQIYQQQNVGQKDQEDVDLDISFFLAELYQDGNDMML